MCARVCTPQALGAAAKTRRAVVVLLVRRGDGDDAKAFDKVIGKVKDMAPKYN